MSDNNNSTAEPTRARGGSFSQAKPKVLRPFRNDEVKILLLENVNATAVEAFRKQGYQVRKIRLCPKNLWH